MTLSPAPRLTVISAWFNRTEGLEESVRSLLDQQGVAFDFVIIDDCSTDETSARLAAIHHPRLRVLRNDRNLGFTQSIRRAAEEATGEYIAIHGAGDLSLPGRLAAQVAFLDANPQHVAVGTGVINHELATGRCEQMLFQPLGGANTPFTHGEVMYRRAAYHAVGGYRTVFQYAQDSDLWRRMGEIGWLGRIEDVLYERRIFADGVARNRSKEVLQAICDNLGVHAAQERAAGRPDPVDKIGALALLTQAMTPRIKARIQSIAKILLRERRFAELKTGLEAVPLGLLSWKLLLLYVAMAPFFPKPKPKPAPPVETFRR